MKKRLLITSIVMMLVVAVALSTATYAWFTSNSSVTAQTVHMTAATSNLESISIAWLGDETKSGLLTASDGSALQPMAPTTNMSGTTAATIAFNGAAIGLDGKFTGEVDSTLQPYTWKNGSDVTAFYINNDSSTTPLNISVAVNEISYYNATANAEIQPLAENTLLQKGQIYYKKVVSGEAPNQTVSWVRLVEDTTANYAEGKYVPDQTKASGTTGDWIVYGTKGIEDYIRVAIFATTEYTSTVAKPSAVVASDYTYKGVLSRTTTIDNKVAYGEITSGTTTPAALTDAATGHDVLNPTASVAVVSNLKPLARVYVIVKVWIDGTYFTGHESGEMANVSLIFNAERYVAPAQP